MSRFLRFFRVFVVAIICGFCALSANAATVNVCDDSSDAGNACVRFDSANAGAPTSFTTPLNNNTKLTAFPYKPGYGYAGHYTVRNCGGTQILNHLGEWTGNSATGGNIYACWVPLVPGGISQPSQNTKLFVLDKNGGRTVGNMWPNLNQPIEFDTNDLGFGGTGRSIRFENRGDWVYLRCYTYRNGICEDLQWRMPRNAAGDQAIWSSTKLFWTIQGVQELPTRSGYAFGGMYSTSGTTGGTQYCNANGNTTDINSLWNNSLPAFNTIYARWNAMTVNLDNGVGGTVLPSTIYATVNGNNVNWYSDINATSPITSVMVTPNGNYVFNGFFTATGVQVVDSDGSLLTSDLADAIYDGITLYPQWVASSTWATLSINNRDGLRSVWKLYYPLSGCSIPGYHTSQDCLNTNVVTSLANWPGHWPVEKDGWSYGGHWTNTNGTNLDGSLNPYIGSNGALQRTITNSTTVYAKWSFSVSLPSGQTTGPNTGCPSGAYCCVFGTECNAPSPTASAPSGQQFAGWACSLVGATGSCARTKYAAGESLLGATNNVNGATGITLTATWESTGATVVYKRVTLNPNGGTGGTQYIYERYLNGVTQGFFTCQSVSGCNNNVCSGCTNPTAISGSIFNSGISQPTNGNRSFKGYYTQQNDGAKRIDSAGYIQSDLYGSAPVTLYAHWGAEPQSVSLNNGAHGEFGGCSVQTIRVVPGEGPLENQLSCVPTANTGWNFIGYYDNDSDDATQYYDANGYAVYPDDVWPDSNAPRELIARYSQILYPVEYYCGNNNTWVHTDYVANGTPYTIWTPTEQTDINTCEGANSGATSTQIGKKLFWKQSNPITYYQPGQNINVFQISSPVSLHNEKLNIYYVTLNHNGAENSPSPNVAYFSNGYWFGNNTATFPITAVTPRPEKVGYTFNGYSTSVNTQVIYGSGAFVTGNAELISTNPTAVTANFSANEYGITLNSGCGNNSDACGTQKIFYFVDKGWCLDSENCTNTTTSSITRPTQQGKIFGGYYTEQGGQGTLVIDGQGTILYTGTGAGSDAMNLIQSLGNNDLELYAKWDNRPSAPSNAFTITTTNLTAGETFEFNILAAGDFYVDWGDDTIDHIIRNTAAFDVGPTNTYSHNYSSAGTKTIKIWGGYENGRGATAYGPTTSVIAFDDGTPLLVGGISGSLGAVFPTLGNGGDGNVPGFAYTFGGCTNLTGLIPYNLFSGVTGNRPYMFQNTFAHTGVTGISGTSAQQAQLFSGVTGSALGIFLSTFLGTNITSIPSGLFDGVSGSAEDMFNSTFAQTNITSIPEGLFNGVSGSANRMFWGTFALCTSLSQLPNTLFAGISNSNNGGSVSVTGTSMFASMFYGDTALSGYVPKTLFANMVDGSGGTLMGECDALGECLRPYIFAGTGLATSCDSYNLTKYTTGFEDYWNGKVSCAPAAVFSCENPDVGGTPNGTLTTIWADQITSSTTLPAATNCTAPTHYTKPSTAYWACTGNSNCTGNPNHWAAGGSKPSWLTSSLTQSVNFYMEYTPNEYTIVLNQNHSSNDNTTVSGSPIKERYGDTWLNSNGVVLNPQKAPVPSSWTNNNTTYNFKGYFTSRSGGTRMTTNDGTFVNDAATHTVGSDGTWYAQWDDSNNVTFKCEENGSAINGYSFSDVQSGDSINVPATSVCTKTGHTFTQWKIVENGVLINETNNGGTYTWNYNFGSDVVPNWQPVQKTITLNKNGGNGGVDTLYTKYGYGAYRDANRTELMTTAENPLTAAPTKSVNLTLSFNGGTVSNGSSSPYENLIEMNNMNLDLDGFYNAETGGNKVIEPQLINNNLKYYITTYGSGGNGASGYTENKTWYARWLPRSLSGEVVPLKPGNVFAGWYTAETGGDQITGPDGNLDGKTIDSNTTWYAQWYTCNHTAYANASLTGENAVYENGEGRCYYKVTCEDGFNQRGGTNTNTWFYVVAPAGSYSGQLRDAECVGSTYAINYENLHSGDYMPNSAPTEYTHGGANVTINAANATPVSNGYEFIEWCTGYNDGTYTGCAATHTINAETETGDKTFYAKWSNTCRPGYTKYNYYTLSSEFDGPVGHPAGTCAPIRYRVKCNNNCPAGEICKACLEDFAWPGHSVGAVRFGGVYNSHYVNGTTPSQIVFGYEPVYAGACTETGNNECEFVFTQSPDVSYMMAPVWYSNNELLYAYVGNNYKTFMNALAANNNTSPIGRDHYTFDGLWTTANNDGDVYIPANGNVAWTLTMNPDNTQAAQAFSRFFVNQLGGGNGTNNNYEVNVYAHWIPDEYTVTLNKNGGSWKTTSVKNIYEKWANGWSKNGTDYYTASTFNSSYALSSSELPTAPTGYNFGGYWTNNNCNGTKIIGADGKLNTSAADSTYGSVSNAKYFGANGSTLYACWTAKQQTITLDRNLGGAHGTSSDITIYTKYGTGVYTNSARTDQYRMRPNPNGTNPVSLPERYFTITYNPNYAGGSTWDSNVLSIFNGYYSSETGGTPYIDNTGYITPTGDSTAQSYTNNKEWHAQWTDGSHDLLLPTRDGYVFKGWYDAPSNGNLVGTSPGTITPISDMTLYADWRQCTYTRPEEHHHSSVNIQPMDNQHPNKCKYHVVCESGYTYDGQENFDAYGEPYEETVSLPVCGANVYTITYYDNPAYETTSGQHILLATPQYYTYNPNNPVVLNPELSSNALSDHHASSVQWCDIDGNNCKTQLAAGATDNKTFYAKWTCATGYTKYGYDTWNVEWNMSTAMQYKAGMCAPIRYRVICNENCPNPDEACNACLENFNMPNNKGNGYSWGNAYNSKGINQTDYGWISLAVPVKSTNTTPASSTVFTINPNYEAVFANWPSGLSSDADLYNAYVTNKNYKTFMEKLATRSYNSNINFGATHYNFDGLWTAANGGNKYIGADGLSPTGGGAFDTQEMSTFFTSDTNVYAHWDPKEYDITLCPENGTACTPGSMSGQVKLKQKWDTGWKIAPSHDNYETAEVFNNNNPLSSRLPTYDGYNFMGYYTEQQSGNNCQGIKIINADGTLNTTVSGISGAKYFENGDGSTLYACWESMAYNISYVTNGGTLGADAPTSATYGATPFHVSNPTHPHGTFKGWYITNLQNGIQHNYGPTDAVSLSTTDTVLDLSQNASMQYFQNLRKNNNETVVFTANWECTYPYQGPACDTDGGVRVTVNAGNGIASVNGGTGWSNNGSGAITGIFAIGTQIDLSNFAIAKTGYTGRAYVKTSGEGTLSGGTFTVDDGDAVITINATGITTPSATISGGATKVYNHQNVTLTASNSVSYDNTINLSYQFVRSDTENGTYTNVTSSGNTYSVSANAYHGTKYYKVKITASGEGSLTSDVAISETPVSVTFKNAPVTFNANGGTLTDGSVSPLYVPYNVNGNLYSTANSETTDTPATVPSATLSNYTFAGWYTTSNGGTRVYDANGNLTSNVSGYVNGGKWVVTDPTNGVVLYAHWTPNIYTVTLDKNGGTNGSVTKIYEKYNTGWSTSNSGTFGTLTLSGNQLPTRTGYTFAGFYDAAGNPKGTYSNGVWAAPGATMVTGATTWYAHWMANTYQIQYNLNNGQTRDNTSVNYGQTTGPIANPTAVNEPNGTYHQESFAGWNVTNMQSGITHFYGTTSSNLTNGGTGTSWDYTTIIPSIKYFKNLRADTDTVLFEAVWNCVPPYQGASCDTDGGVMVTVNAGDGIASVNGGTGWTGNGTGTITRTVAVGTSIDLSNFATAKAGYTGRAYVKTSGGGTLDGSTFIVGEGTAVVITIKATGIETPSVTLSPATTNQIYNYQPVTLTATAKRSDGSEYAQGITFAYEFAEASSTSGPWNYAASASNTKNIDKDEFLGSKFYKARVTASGEGNLSSSSAVAESDVASVELNQKQLTFDTNGGTLGDTSGRYIRYDSDKLYAGATDASEINVPGATWTGYDFDGWFTQAEGGDKIYNADLTLAYDDVDEWIGDGVWKSTIARKVYAHWVPKVLEITLNRNGATNGTAKFYEKYGVGYASTESATDWVLTQITVPTKTGYDFAGYYDTEDFNGTMVIGTNGKMPMTDGVVDPTYFTQDTILYAKWTKKSYTVTYDCNGNGAGNTQAAEYDTNFTVRTLAQANCDTSVPGATFGGWAVTPAGGTRQPGAVFTWKYTANQTFTAIWTNNTYTLTYSCGTGTGTPPASWTGNYHAPITVSGVGNCAKVGHSFTGWAVTPAGGTQQPGAIAGGWPYTANQTFTAQWTADTYSINYDENGGTRGLPTGYTLLEYVSGGTFDTGLNIGTDDIFEVKYATTAASTAYQFGYRGASSSSSANSFHATYSGSQVALLAVNSSSNAKTFKATQTIDVPLTVRWNGSVDIRPTANGTAMSVSGSTTEQTNPSQTFVIGGEKINGTVTQSSKAMKIYYFRTFDSDGVWVTHNFVPVKDSSDVISMYDTITGTFLNNRSNRTLSGPDATDTQVIDDAYPESYTYGVGAKVYGVPTRAHSVFDGWCETETSSGNLGHCQTPTPPFVIGTNARSDKILHAKWTCEDGYTQSSDKQSCVANSITLDWNENGGVGLTNGSCTYNGDLTLAGAPTYANHVFNGWKTYDNSGIFAANTQITGGCTDTYTGVTSGTSTAITAQWCNACNPTNATCELNASVPGTCLYATECNTGYDYQSGENTATPVCVPHTYTITYNVNGGTGSIANQSVEYLAGFDTNDATGISKNNSIVKSWTVVSGGNYTGVGAHYDHYDVASDTALKANWATCTCSHGSDVASCNTSASNNQCHVTVTCASGYDQSTASGSCEEENCSATCEAGRYTITLNKNNGTGGTTTLYTIYGTGSDAGVYINYARTNKMTPNPNGTYPIVKPTLSRTVSYDITSNGTVSNASFAESLATTNTNAAATFTGYYISTTDTDRYIENDGYINAAGVSKGKEYATNKTWYAQWTYGSVTLPVAYRPGYTLSGWSTTVGGTSIGNAGDSYTTGSNVTLYPVWTQCAAGTYCPGSETVNGSEVYNQIHNCPTNYSNSAAGSTRISDCYLVLTPGKWVQTAGNGMSTCQQDYYCDGDGIEVYYSDETNDGRLTTWIQKSCAENAGSTFNHTDGTGASSINQCYKTVILNKRGGSGNIQNYDGTMESGTNSATQHCSYQTNCVFSDASVLTLAGHTFHGGWTDSDTDCTGTTHEFVVPNDTNTYYACRTTNSYTVTLKDGLNTNTVFGTIKPTYGAAMPSVDSNGNPLTVPTKTADHTTYIFEGYYDAQQNGTSATQYYDYNLNSTHDWDMESNGTLYARWSVTCDPGYYLPANATSCTTLCSAGRYCAGDMTFTSFDVPKSSNQGLSGYIAAGYYSTGGASTATPTAAGNGCVSGNSCGLVAGGYYSTGGGTSATPTTAGNGCVSGSGRSCGVLGAIYYSNGGGTNDAGACVTGQICGACPTEYRSNPDTGKTAITQCTAACSAGTKVATAETTTNNGCKTPLGNTWWSNAHTVAYGSASPTVTGVNENGVHMCATNYRTANTNSAGDHDGQHDCKRSIVLMKNNGTTVDGAVWPDNVTDQGTTNATAICYEDNATCAFGNPAELLERPGYTFQNRWGTTTTCANPVVSPVATADITSSRYFACRVQDDYTLTYACGDGTTGDAPNQQTNIHYGDTVSVSGAGGCAKTGHTFAGWAVSGTSDVITATTWPHDITWNYDGSKTFTAQWTANTYNVSYVWNGGTSGSILPDGYTQLEYIQSDGNQYIVTNFVPSSDFKHTIVFEALNSSDTSTYIAGTVYTAGRAGNTVIKNGKVSAIYGNNVSNNYINLMTNNSNNVSVVNNKSILVMDLHSDATNTITLNGKSIAGTNTGKITSTSPMSLFAYGAGSGKSSIKLYSDTIEQNGVLVHNYVPAQNSNGVVGLYDTVTGVFLTNRGNGSFTPGNPVTAAYPNQYTYGVGATVTGGAVRANSVFEGWCRTASLTNCAAPHEITTTDLDDIELYAKWGCATGYHNVDNQCVVNEFKLMYGANGHGTVPEPGYQTCTYGEEINLWSELLATGWNFGGWNIAGNTFEGGQTIICNEVNLGVTGGATMTEVDVTAAWTAACNMITLRKGNDATWPSGAITTLYAKTRESGSTTDGKWYKDNGCTTEYTSADYAKVIPTRLGWAFRGFYADSNNATDINATQTNGVEQHIDHTGAPTSTGQTFINGLNVPATLYAGWAQDCTDPVAHGTCSRTIGQNTTYTTSCATGYHYDPTASESTYNPICVPNTITIILDKNGGNGTCGGQSGTTSGALTCSYDGTCNTPVWGNTCALSKTGKIFAGWNTAANGTGTQYGTATVAGDVQNINNGTTSTTLYAVWENAVCNVTNGSAAVSVSGNTAACDVTCNNGYESNGIYTGQQHATSVTTGQCNAGTYDINYHYDAEHGGALASLLPEGYTQLEYIESTGTQYIDTGINGLNTGNWEIYAKWMVTDTPTANYPYIVGAYSGETVNAYRVILKLKETDAYYVSGNSKAGGGSVLVSNKPANMIHTATINNGYVVFDGVSYNTPTQGTTIPASVSIKLFSSNGTGILKGRIYASYAKKDGVYKYNYIPAKRNRDNVVGMYDLADPNPETAFHGNAGTGIFGAGNPVTEMHPNQYTYGTGAAVYGGATRANSVFEGWCRNAALTDGCTMVPHTIGADEYGIKNLYAKWSCVNGYHLDGNNQCVGNTITINYNKGEHGVGAAPQPTTCTFGGTAPLRPGVSDPAWVFSGWRILDRVYGGGANITCDHDTLGVYGNTSDDNTVTAIGQWEADTFVVSYSCGDTTWTPNTTPADDVATTGVRYYARQNTCVNPGYRFAGWRPEGETTNWVDGTPWNYTEDKTFVAQWVFDPSFMVTITVPANTSFEFKTYTKGQFVVDWGDSSELDVRKPTVTSTAETWSHSYTNAGTYVVKIGGLATEYSSSLFKPAIIFFTGTAGTNSSSYETINSTGTEQYIYEISGSLGRIFPTLGTGGTKQPHFTRTFMNATNMETDIATLGNLFSGIGGAPVTGMFMQTFQNCSNLEGRIPATLFPINGAPAQSVFRATFKDCSKLTYIPKDLFVGLVGAPQSVMFYRTFEGCTGLTEIPEGLFRNISGAPASYMFARTFYGCSNVVGNLSSNLFGSINGAPAGHMFYQTFANCTELVGTGGEFAIPDGMFGVLSGDAAENMFYGTFDGCQNLTGKIGRMYFDNLTGDPAAGMFREMFKGCKKISGGLRAGMFGNMTGAPADNMFMSTFNGCSGLTDSIPSGLFGNISGPAAKSMFYATFFNSGVSGAIPANLFKGNGEGISGTAANMFRSTFYGCSGLTGEIPSGLFGTPSGSPAAYMFYYTFYGCSGLSGTIPSGLFGNLSGPGVAGMFGYTFKGCTNLSGYVPEGLFGEMTVPSSYPSEMMTHIFVDSGLDTACPCGTVEAQSDFKTYWRSTADAANPKKVSCRVEQTPGAFYWYNGICTTKCPLDTMDELHVGNLSPYPVLAEEVSVRNVAVKYNDTTCYVPLARGVSANNLNVRYGNPSFHLERAADTPPAWFGQR